jgi:hypothetical protein
MSNYIIHRCDPNPGLARIEVMPHTANPEWWAGRPVKHHIEFTPWVVFVVLCVALCLMGREVLKGSRQ